MIRHCALAGLAAISLGFASGCTKFDDPDSASGTAALMMCQRVFVDKIDKNVAWSQFVKPQVQEGFSVSTSSFSVDADNGTVTATVASISREAVFREGIGCTVLVDRTASELRSQPVVAPAPAALDAAGPWPSGGAGTDPTALSSDQLAAVKVALDNTLFNKSGVKMHAAAIAFRGKLAFEKYAPSITADSPLAGYSMSKTVVALGLGVLYGEGKLQVNGSLNIGSWAPDAKPRGTYLNFLQMESGLEWDEDGDRLKKSQVRPDDFVMFFDHGDQAAYAASKRQADDPGAVFNYASGNTALLQRSLQNVLTGDPNALPEVRLQAGMDFYASKLFLPLHVKTALFQPDEAGNLVFPVMSARDWLRFGELVRNKGKVGEQQVVPADWIENVMLKPSEHDASYGGHIVLSPDVRARKRSVSGGVLSFEDGKVPHFVTYFRGFGGQRVFVVPDMQLVMVVICNGSLETYSGADALKGLREVMYALRDTSQAEW